MRAAKQRAGERANDQQNRERGRESRTSRVRVRCAAATGLRAGAFNYRTGGGAWPCLGMNHARD